MPLETYRAWEDGSINDIDAPRLIQLLRVLNGTVVHIQSLVGLTPEQAHQRLSALLRVDEHARAIRHLSPAEIAHIVVSAQRVTPSDVQHWIAFGELLAREALP